MSKNPSPLADAMQEKLNRWYAGELPRMEIESFIRYGNLNDNERARLGLITTGVETCLRCGAPVPTGGYRIPKKDFINPPADAPENPLVCEGCYVVLIGIIKEGERR